MKNRTMRADLLSSVRIFALLLMRMVATRRSVVGELRGVTVV
jgi:hypothetical protein